MTRENATKYIPFVFVLLWSTGFISAKFGVPYMDPFYLLLVRSILTIFAFIGLILIYRAGPIRRDQAMWQVLIGMLIHGAYLGGVFFAIEQGLAAGFSSIIVGLQPVLTAAISLIFLGKTLSRAALFGLFLGFLGIVLVIAGKMDPNAPFSWLGFFSAVVALFGISIGTLIQKSRATGAPLLTGTVFQYVGAAMVFAIMTFLIEDQYVNVTPTLVLTMLWLVFGLSVTAILLLMVMIREGEVAKVSSYFYLVPPLVVFESWVLFGETMTPLSLFGTGLAVFAVYLVNKR